MEKSRIVSKTTAILMAAILILASLSGILIHDTDGDSLRNSEEIFGKTN